MKGTVIDVDPVERRHGDRAVSPVIGVILMVAITVIIAAVIGTYVLDLGGSVGRTGPTVSLSISDAEGDYEADAGTYDAFVIEHQGGDELDLADLRITVRDVSNNDIALSWTGSGGIAAQTGTWNVSYNGDTAITSGATQTMNAGDILVLNVSAGASGNPPGDDQEYGILVSDREARSTVARATVVLA